MDKITKQIRIRKDYFMIGYFSVHETEYRNGKLSYESYIGKSKTKKGAMQIKKDYMKQHPRG